MVVDGNEMNIANSILCYMSVYFLNYLNGLSPFLPRLLIAVGAVDSSFELPSLPPRAHGGTAGVPSGGGTKARRPRN